MDKLLFAGLPHEAGFFALNSCFPVLVLLPSHLACLDVTSMDHSIPQLWPQQPAASSKSRFMSGFSRQGQATRRPLTSAVLRPCSPLLSDAASGCLQRSRSEPLAFAATASAGFAGFAGFAGSTGSRGFEARPGLFGASRPKSRSSPTAGVLQENTRAESCAAELERALRKDASGTGSSAQHASAEHDWPNEMAEVTLRDKFQEDWDLEGFC